jgi:hypothetical protein
MRKKNTTARIPVQFDKKNTQKNTHDDVSCMMHQDWRRKFTFSEQGIIFFDIKKRQLVSHSLAYTRSLLARELQLAGEATSSIVQQYIIIITKRRRRRRKFLCRNLQQPKHNARTHSAVCRKESDDER